MKRTTPSGMKLRPRRRLANWRGRSRDEIEKTMNRRFADDSSSSSSSSSSSGDEVVFTSPKKLARVSKGMKIPRKGKEEEEEYRPVVEEEDEEIEDIDSSSSSFPSDEEFALPPTRSDLPTPASSGGGGGGGILIEKPTLEQVERLVHANTMYLDSLMTAHSHFRFRNADNAVLNGIQERITDTLNVLHTWCPVTQTAPEARAVPQTIPEADGSEVRFSHVAAERGWGYEWARESNKQEVYQRAAQLYRDMYGTWPKRLMMWTASGRKPVQYYTAETAKGTLCVALQEWHDRKHRAESPEF